MAILKHDDEHAGRPNSRRFAWLALAPVIVALLLVGFLGWVACSTEPVTVGRYQFIGPRYAGQSLYVWTRGSVSSVWVSNYNPVSSRPVMPWGSSVVFARGMLTTTPGMQAWVWMNRGGAGHAVTMRILWQWQGFAILEETR